MKPVCYILYFKKDDKVKFYIGQTANFEERLKQHKNLLEKNKHINAAMQGLYNDGWELTKYKLFPVKNKKLAHDLEQQFIKEQKENVDLLNIELGNDTYSRNPNKAEIKEKLITALKNWREQFTEEEFRKLKSRPGISNPMFGKSHTDESRKLISDKLKDFYLFNPSPNLGLKRSKSERARLSELASQRVGDKNPFYGKHHSLETRTKLSKARIGNKPANSKKIIIGGITYPSITEAGRQLKLNASVVLWRVNSKNIKFIDWQWFKCPTTIESTSIDGSE